MAMSDRPSRPTMTPYHLFDERPKVESVPRIPRAPRVATDVDVGTRDTDITGLQDAELGDDDKTPSDPETPHEMILRKLSGLERAVKDTNLGSRRCYQLLVDLHAKVDAERRERVKLTARVRGLELANRWVPRIAWLVTTAIAMIALLRTYR